MVIVGSLSKTMTSLVQWCWLYFWLPPRYLYHLPCCVSWYSSQATQIRRTVGYFPSLEASMPTMINLVLRKETCSSLPAQGSSGLCLCQAPVFSKKKKKGLISTSGGQPEAITMLYNVLGIFETALFNNLKEIFSDLSWDSFLWSLILEGVFLPEKWNFI